MNEKKQNPFADSVNTRTKKDNKFELNDLYQQAQNFFSWKLFKAGGRIGRLRYISFTLGVIFVGSAIGIISFFIPAIGYLLSALILIATFIAIAILTIQRCHDFNLHTLLALAILIVFPISVLIFYLIPGNDVENKYGVPPPENTTAVVVFAVLLPILFILLLVALFLLTFSLSL